MLVGRRVYFDEISQVGIFPVIAFMLLFFNDLISLFLGEPSFFASEGSFEHLSLFCVEGVVFDFVIDIKQYEGILN